MKKNHSTILKGIFITGLSVFFIFPAMAQREKREISLLTKDQVKRITDIVKPLKEQFEKQLSREDLYNNYVEDLKAVHSATTIEDKGYLTAQIAEKYSSFFKDLWSRTSIDVAPYQQQIRQVFPENIASLIQFDAYLNFTLLVSVSTKPMPELEPNKCVDVCGIAAGEITGNSSLIAAGGGDYGNCFLKTSAWGTGAFFAGFSELSGWLRNNITIPGTFPDDTRKLRIKKSYEVRLEATSFAAIGGGYAETRMRTFQSSEYMLVYAPFIWGSHQVRRKTISENYLIEKKNVANSQFRSNSNTVSLFGSGNWCFSDCSNIKWTICEE